MSFSRTRDVSTFYTICCHLLKAALVGVNLPQCNMLAFFFQMRWRQLGRVEQRCLTKEVGDIGDSQEREIKKTAKDLWMSQKTAWRLLIGQ